jgi:hypothetical protein
MRQPAPVYCPRCGDMGVSGARFCPRCGAPLPQSRVPPRFDQVVPTAAAFPQSTRQPGHRPLSDRELLARRATIVLALVLLGFVIGASMMWIASIVTAILSIALVTVLAVKHWGGRRLKLGIAITALGLVLGAFTSTHSTLEARPDVQAAAKGIRDQLRGAEHARKEAERRRNAQAAALRGVRQAAATFSAATEQPADEKMSLYRDLKSQACSRSDAGRRQRRVRPIQERPKERRQCHRGNSCIRPYTTIRLRVALLPPLPCQALYPNPTSQLVRPIRHRAGRARGPQPRRHRSVLRRRGAPGHRLA